MVTISVITPAYNAANTIPATIKSVLGQSFTDFEYIIVDDGSSDQTLAVIEQFSDARIQVLSHQNAGPQISRNRGLAQAQGKYVSFVDADDVWTEDKLELQLAALQTHSEASVAYSWCDVIDEQGNFVRRGGHWVRRGDVFADLLLVNFGENGSNFLADTAAVRAVGGFDETIVAGQDRDMLLSLASQYQFEVVPKVQVLYRKSTTTKSWSASITRTRAGIEQVINKHSAHQPELSDYRQQGLSNAYKHMIFECLNNHPSRQKGLYAMQLLWLAVTHDWSFVTKKAFLKTLVRILITVTLPQAINCQLIQRYPKIFDIRTIYEHLKIDKKLVSQQSKKVKFDDQMA